MELLINMTIGGTATACLILLIKQLLKNKLTPKWHFYIWLILAVRLMIPVLPESGFSLFNAVPAAQDITTVQNEVPGNIDPADTISSRFVEGNVIVKSPITGIEQRRTFSVPEQRVNLLLAGWITGAFLMAGYLTGVYWIFNRRTKKLPECRDAEILELLRECRAEAGIYSDRIVLRFGGSTPMLHGVLKPAILIPEGYSREELRHVLIHELCHYKHKDIFVNIICSAFLCVYWFNPVLWISFYTIRRDIEFLCDERVIEITGERKEYSRTLLKTALKRNQFLFATTSMQNGEKEVSKRIKRIAYFKKTRLWISVLAILAVLLTGAVCLTDASGLNPVKPYGDNWPKTAEKLLDDYFKNYVAADMSASSDVSGYKIESIEAYGDQEASWSVIYSNITVFRVDYTLYIAYPDQYSFPGGGFEIGEGNKTKIYKDQLAVFKLDNLGNAKFLGFVWPQNIAEMGETKAILHTISYTDPAQSPEAMLKLKTPYIGDNSKVGRILASLPLDQYSTGMELHTKSEPYGLTVNYDLTESGVKVFESRPGKPKTDSSGWDPNPYLKAQLYKNSAILLALIDNCSKVEFKITGMSENGVPYTYYYLRDRETTTEELSQDPRRFTDNPESFTEFMNQLESIQMSN